MKFSNGGRTPARDRACDRYVSPNAPRQYLITQLINAGQTTEYAEYVATCLSEALMLAERANAGQRTITYGIQREDYDEARSTGIAFHAADGLLI